MTRTLERAVAAVRELAPDVVLRAASLCDGHTILDPQVFTDTEGRVLNLSPNNLRREFHRMLKRAEIEPWDDCFRVLRRNCETDWS